MPVREFRQTVYENYEVEISKWVARKTRAKTIQLIKGSAEVQYKKIWEYCNEIKKTREGSIMEVMFTPFRLPTSNPRFMRLYCCLRPLKQGFKDGCRPIIGLDGCHLKGTYPGQLLTALGVDPNNGYWPIAWAVVEKEATEQWKWFLKLLRDASKEGFWNIAYCTTSEHFNEAMSNLETYDKEAHSWVKKAPHPRHWCKTFFPTHTKCDILVNNLCESFNAHILEFRDHPIISLLETIREYIMDRIQQRKAAMEKCKGPIGPLPTKIVDERVKRSTHWNPIWNAAVAAIHRNNGNSYNEVEGCYNADLFLKIYCNIFEPISGEILWPPSIMSILDPPLTVAQPERPRKARKRDITKGKNHGRKLRRRIVIHCRKCGKVGHNTATCCKEGSTQSNQVEEDTDIGVHTPQGAENSKSPKSSTRPSKRQTVRKDQ
ncbi:uncharacterized protein LOC113782007 [Coffea eugenioides]|uniref:uncharacterized protein LOC113782007 n=1 Tax=Coffea eugenioides TaxID=49369 RepID=UPI000F6083B8|nr:uncharacterized protein LOC113782007 [Coffea eugenioides]